jgi:hypothetical protein
MRTFCTLAILALTISIDCDARVCIPSRAEKNEGLQYATNLIESFRWAKEGTSSIPSSMPQAQSLEGLDKDARAAMLALKLASEDYECAATLVEPYVRSKTLPVQISATGSAATYRKLITINSGLVQTFKDTLNGKATAKGDLADRLTDFSVQSDNAWELLLRATGAVTFAIVVAPKEGEALSTLNMTAGQRGDLNNSLEEVFGDALKKDQKEIQSKFEGAGWVLYEFINRPQWKMLDKQ